MNNCNALVCGALACVGSLPFCLPAATYSDDYLETTDASVVRSVDGTDVIYAFTNAAAGSVSVSFKTGMTFSRYLVAGGGASGGSVMGGGGGGGGVLTATVPGITYAAGDTLTLSVGAGGVAPVPTTGSNSVDSQPAGRPGGNSILTFGGTTIKALGGGGGCGWSQTHQNNPDGNGSGGGGCSGETSTGAVGTAGQGYKGGSSSGGCGGGGGGAAQVGGNGEGGANTTGATGTGGKGGDGLASDITGRTLYYGAGGGGGCGWKNTQNPGAGGRSGDGTGVWGKGSDYHGVPGTATGPQPGQDGFGGGGGGGTYADTNTPQNQAGKGGTGTVVLRFSPLSDRSFIVASNVETPGVMTPAPGAYIYDAASVTACTAINQTNETAGTRGRCVGYKLETYDPATSTWSTLSTSKQSTYSHVQPAVGVNRLTWQWDVDHRIRATAAGSGTVCVDEGAAGAVADVWELQGSYGASHTLVATPASGVRFLNWTGDVAAITSGDVMSPTITVSSATPISLTANFLSTDSANYLQFVNAFEHPKTGAFLTTAHASTPGSFFSNTVDRVIAFTAPDDAPAGLREFYHASPTVIGLTADWGYFKTFTIGQRAETKTGVACAEAEVTGLTTDNSTYTYAGSWYVPADATYSFRMNVNGIGQLVLDNQIVLQQTSTAKVVTTNGVALAQGWHTFFAVFVAKGGKIGPAETTPGLLYSAANADLAADATAGSVFAAQEDGHRVSTAYSGVLVPSIFVGAGATMYVDCANVVSGLRVAGQVGSVSGKIKFYNLSANRTLEVGRPFTPATSGEQSMDNLAWLDVDHTEIPDGVKIRYEGGVAIDKLFPGHDWSLGRRLVLSTTLADFFGVVASGAETFTIPDNIYHLSVGRPAVLGDKVKIIVPGGRQFAFGGATYSLTNKKGFPFRYNSTADVFRNEIEVAKGGYVQGTTCWDATSTLAGSVRGAGWLGMTGWGRRINVSAPIDVGTVSLGQRGNRFMLRPIAGTTIASKIASVSISGDASPSPTRGWDYCGATLFYGPLSPDQPALSLGTVTANGASWYPDQTKQRRSGATMSTCSNNTVNVTSLKGSGVNLRTVIPGATNADPEEIDRGFANFNIGEINQAMTIYVSSNVNISVTNVKYATNFRYDVQEGAINDAVLDIEGSCVASTLKAVDIASMPARIKGFVGTVTLTDQATRTYPITMDFSKDVPNHGGCDGSGTLAAAPAGGALAVTVTGDELTKGDYGLVRFTDVGTLLDAWTVTGVPSFYKGHSIKLMRDATGIWLKVRKSGGLLIFR